MSNEAPEAVRYLTKFSRLIRQILDNSTSHYISLKDVKDTMQNYLELEKLRLDNNLNYTIIIDNQLDIDDTFMPFMAIQPHVENAIWHGLVGRETNRQLIISFTKYNNDQFICTIEDNGIGRVKSMSLKSKHQSKGTKMIQEILTTISDISDVPIEQNISDLTDDQGLPRGTRIEIKFPLYINQNNIDLP
ncbi:MAG: histidine kinase [Saprospiraceae bacterium]|nr:histidine kinase [Saprospiraceae bacterium]